MSSMISIIASLLLCASTFWMMFTPDNDYWSISFKCGITSNIVYWSLGFIGLCLDSLAAIAAPPTQQRSPTSSSSSHNFSKGNALRHYKIQPNTFLTNSEIQDLICLTSFNMIVIALLICCPIFESIWNYVQPHRLDQEMIDDWIFRNEILCKIPICAVITELGFYSFHYWLHSNTWLYRHIHKVHHRFKAPTALCCVYAHPIEFVVGNMFPIYLGLILTNAHPYTSYLIWTPLAMIGTCIGHCGYYLPLPGRSIKLYKDPHDDHHLYYKNNYGGMYLLDYLLGTITPTTTTTTTSNRQ